MTRYPISIYIASLLFVSLVACASLSRQPTPAFTPTSSIIPSTHAPKDTETPIATFVVRPSLTIQPVASSTPTMPAYFKPNPALMPLTDWEALHGSSATNTRTPTPEPLPDLQQRSELQGGELEQIWSPDRKHILVINQSQAPSAPLQLEDRPPLPSGLDYQQVWVLNIDSGDLTLLFDGVRLNYKWADNRFIVITGSCYGGWDSGLYVLDTQEVKLYVLDARYPGLCEGDTPLSIAPNGKNLIYGSRVVAVPGGDQIRICPENEYAWGHVWSHNGQYAYVACGVRDEPYVLHRFDTETYTDNILVDGTQITFKTTFRMWLSPDEKFLFFVWGNSNFIDNTEKYGIWVLDLAQLDK